MSRDLKIVLFSFSFVLALLLVELLYLSTISLQEQTSKKRDFVQVVGLSDLALVNSPSLRHRSLSGFFELYSMDGALGEYETATFVYSKEIQ